MDFSRKRVLVLGLARSGLAAAKVLHKLGAVVTIADIRSRQDLQNEISQIPSAGIKVFTECYPRVASGCFDFLVISPGIPSDILPCQEAGKAGIPIISETELAYWIKPENVELIAITGTNGKTTTTALLQHILSVAGFDAFSGGNIGIPLVELLDTMVQGTVVVEMSSFQLENCSEFKPHICALLNITPDHLNRHKSIENYVAAKAKIFNSQSQNDLALFNYDDSILFDLAATCTTPKLFFSVSAELEEGFFIRDSLLMSKVMGIEHELACIQDINLRGRHNLENVLCAAAIAFLKGVSSDIIRQSLRSFTGVRHRMEEVTRIDQVLFINDSKATNPESAIKAIEAFISPIILIAGGRSKGSDFSQLAQVICHKTKAVILLGEARQEIKDAVIKTGFANINIYETKDLTEAVNLSFILAEPGDVVLLSPACASWDMFDNYEQRGDQFCALVKAMIPG